MAPHEIFAQMTPATASSIFSFLFENEKKLYKAAIESLAKQRNLRPIFVERKPREERFTWMQGALGRKASDGVGAHLLQIWLIGEQSKLLCAFLDGLGIEHDENGTVEELPSAPALEKLAGVVDSLLAENDPQVVAVYLHTFQALDDQGGWSTLGELLEKEPRLKLSAA